MTHVIVGARSVIMELDSTLERIQEWAQGHRSEVLAADARAVFGRDHLESAVRHAARARDTQTMSARTLPTETLLYLAGQRQIVEAIRVAGLREGTTSAAVVLWDIEGPEALLRELGWTRDDSVLEAMGKSLEVLGVNETDQGTVSEAAAADLALERVALLDLTK